MLIKLRSEYETNKIGVKAVNVNIIKWNGSERNGGGWNDSERNGGEWNGTEHNGYKKVY